MELLGVGPGEILLILIIMLLVFGPERLPEFARQAGRFVVRVRNWVQQSPDAALILRARQDLETELEALRAELTREVESVRQDLQTVRSDLVDASKLIEESAQEVASTSTIDLKSAGTGVSSSDSVIRPPAAGTTPDIPPAATTPATAPPDEFEVDPGPIGARRARVAEHAHPVTPADPVPATIAGGETVARGARTDTAPPPAASDLTLASADMAAIDALSRQVASIAEELARLRVQVLRRMAEEKQAPVVDHAPADNVSAIAPAPAAVAPVVLASDNGTAGSVEDAMVPARGVEAPS